MTRLISEVVDGVRIEREMTAKEEKEFEAAAEIDRQAQQILKNKEIARQSALAKLAALGLTEDEIAAL